MLCCLLFEGKDEYVDISSLPHTRFYEVTACHLRSCANASKLMASARDAEKKIRWSSLYMARLKSGFKSSVSLWYHSRLNQSHHHPISVTTTLVILILMIIIRCPGVIAIIPPHGLKHIQYLRNSRLLLINLDLFGILSDIRMIYEGGIGGGHEASNASIATITAIIHKDAANQSIKFPSKGYLLH